nr:hypothetical protein [Noviherbaspirillum autotrophicum]
MNSAFKAAIAPLAMSMLLGGCAVYEPAYSDYPYSQAAPVYVEQGYGYYYPPAPVYVQPPPVYVGPPVRFSFNFGYWSGGGGHGGHHWGGGHPWGGGNHWGGGNRFGGGRGWGGVPHHR